jgi:hypothetical protein
MNGFVVWLQIEKCHLPKIITFAPAVFLHVPLTPSNFRLGVFRKINLTIGSLYNFIFLPLQWQTLVLYQFHGFSFILSYVKAMHNS